MSCCLHLHLLGQQFELQLFDMVESQPILIGLNKRTLIFVQSCPACPRVVCYHEAWRTHVQIPGMTFFLILKSKSIKAPDSVWPWFSSRHTYFLFCRLDICSKMLIDACFGNESWSVFVYTHYAKNPKGWWKNAVANCKGGRISLWGQKDYCQKLKKFAMAKMCCW